MNKKKFISGLMSMAFALSIISSFTVNAVDEDWGRKAITRVEMSMTTVKITHRGYDYPISFLRGDLNLEKKVNITDVSILASKVYDKKNLMNWDLEYVADINGDGIVNVTDLSILSAKVKGKKELGAPKYKQLVPSYIKY